MHLPRGIEVEWVKQLVAEQLRTAKDRRGFARQEWEKLRERNEALDCRVYARAAAAVVGVDRFDDRRWDDLEATLPKAPANTDEDRAPPLSPPPPAASFRPVARRRRRLAPG